ncbi:hypothetical protein GOBAR_DD17973 [Gossypium barbadense]|nr:hypothetical protein GOBAR_DD17973 [Gossypium barbadense]
MGCSDEARTKPSLEEVTEAKAFAAANRNFSSYKANKAWLMFQQGSIGKISYSQTFFTLDAGTRDHLFIGCAHARQLWSLIMQTGGQNLMHHTWHGVTEWDD